MLDFYARVASPSSISGGDQRMVRGSSHALSMNRSAELQLGEARRAPNAPTWRSALQARGSWSQCMRKSERKLSMNLKTLGLIPKSLRISGSWSQCATKKACRLPMNRLVAQAFQPAGLPDFRVRWTRNGRLESRPNPQARKPALRTRLGSWSQCARHMAWRLPMNRSAELQPGAVWRAPNAPTWRSALQARGSWSQCVRNGKLGLSM